MPLQDTDPTPSLGGFGLKLQATRLFLRDWFASKPSIPQLGHGLEESLVDRTSIHRRHVRDGGGVPEEILLRKKEYVLSCPTSRSKQKYADFSLPAVGFDNSSVKSHIYGRRARFGEGGIEYVAFIGLRGDEHLRTARVEARKSDPHTNAGYEGEHVYMPLAKMHVTRENVNDFWDQQDWGLKLPDNGALSNCVYCFLKGAANLSRVHTTMEPQKGDHLKDFGALRGTPCDIDWWSRIEDEYGRDLVAEGRDRKSEEGPGFIGFFGNNSSFSYKVLGEIANDEERVTEYANVVLPCDCTE